MHQLVVFNDITNKINLLVSIPKTELIAITQYEFEGKPRFAVSYRDVENNDLSRLSGIQGDVMVLKEELIFLEDNVEEEEESAILPEDEEEEEELVYPPDNVEPPPSLDDDMQDFGYVPQDILDNREDVDIRDQFISNTISPEEELHNLSERVERQQQDNISLRMALDSILFRP